MTIIPTEDFWSRQRNAQCEAFEFAPFGIPAKITANQPEVLAAARLSAGRFSSAVAVTAVEPITIQLVVQSEPAGPLPAGLAQRLTYAGTGPWITLSARGWGHGFAHLPTRTAVAVLSSALAAHTRLVSRYIIDHYVLNFILTDWAMLHASCVLHPGGMQHGAHGRLLLMVAPHNTGKSTTALRLLRTGFPFLADGMAILRYHGGRLLVGGYPVGEVKLRDDVLALFPEYSGPRVRVREQQKTVVNLRMSHPTGLVEELISPRQVDLCFVEQAGSVETRVDQLSRADVLPLLAGNTVYWDEPTRLAHNDAILQRLVESAGLYRLKIGTDPAGLIRVLESLPDSAN